MRKYLAVKNKNIAHRAKSLFTIKPDHSRSIIQYHGSCIIRTIHFCLCQFYNRVIGDLRNSMNPDIIQKE